MAERIGADVELHPMKTLRMVRVLWWDAEDAGDTWVSRDDAEAYANHPCEVVSWGYLVKRTNAYTVLAADIATASMSGVQSYGRVTKIPTAWIRSMKAVRG